MALGILYPNGKVEGVIVYIWDTITLQPIVWDGTLTGGGGDGAINDGVNAAIKATVVDYLNGASVPATTNPVMVMLADTTGAPYVASGGASSPVVAYSTGNVSTTTQRVVLATNVGLPAGTAALGTVVVTSGTISVSNTVSVTIANASVAVTGPLTDAQLRATPVPVSFTSGTVSVTGTVTTAPAVAYSNGAVTSTTQRVVITSDQVTGTLATEVTVNAIKDQTDQFTFIGGALSVTGGGAGVQYTEGTTATTITGTAIMWRKAGDVLTPVDTTNPLPVTFTSGTVSVSGTVTVTVANATLSVIPAVAYSTGNVSTTTQRVVLATDVGLPAGTAALGTVIVTSGTIAVTGNVNATISNASLTVVPSVAYASGTNTNTTQRITIATDDIMAVAIGATTGAAVITDTNGSVQQYLRGLVSMLATGTTQLGYVGGKPTYAATTGMTWTGTSLANGSARESTVVSNTSTRYSDFRIFFQTMGQTNATALVDVYVYTAIGNTTYTDGATGSDAAFTAANRRNSRYLGSIQLGGNGVAVQAEMQLSDIFKTCPDKWGLIVINNSGATLSGTAGNHIVQYQGVN